MPLYSIDTHGELHPFINQEWLLTNGSGAFASSSLVNCNRRRYHGLLCAATKPPVGRIMTLARVGELVFLDGKTTEFQELSTNHFGNTLHPRGDRYLRRFELDETAKWEYSVDNVKVTKELLLCRRKNTIGLRYVVEPTGEQANKRAVQLDLLAFVNMRDFHSLRQGTGTNFDVQCSEWELKVGAGETTLHLRGDAGRFERRNDWWYGHDYPIESERGMDHAEDLYVPGVLIHKGTGKWSLTLWASTDPIKDLPDWDAEVKKRQTIAASSDASPTLRKLTRAANDFIVERKRPDGTPGTTIIAGYPWFADWGRDTMISLPGLLLTTRRFEEAAQVLSVFADHVSEGMIPNRFNDYTNEPEFNTVDASLWFVNACFEYLKASNDRATFDSTLLPACKKIVNGYRKGTRFHIKMDEFDGLITAGDDHTQLTWMDAKCDGVAFTPRHGKAVEINALWFNALILLDERDLAAKVKDSFSKAFWISPFRGLNDTVLGDRKDAAVRPNQIFAVSVPNSPLNHDQQSAVVEVVRRELLTPYGLRTLNKSDAHYCGRYCGGPWDRDRAYHNGTVWPWLIGPFLEAYLKVHQHSPDSVRQVRVWLQPLLDHMHSACIGQISECFEADEPHRPVAAPAQAWSVAEALRIAAMVGL